MATGRAAPGVDAAAVDDATTLKQEAGARRRISGRICERLVSHGKWSPNWMLAATVPRGVADAGEVRAALEVLGETEWVVLSARRGSGHTLRPQPGMQFRNHCVRC